MDPPPRGISRPRGPRREPPLPRARNSLNPPRPCLEPATRSNARWSTRPLRGCQPHCAGLRLKADRPATGRRRGHITRTNPAPTTTSAIAADQHTVSKLRESNAPVEASAAWQSRRRRSLSPHRERLAGRRHWEVIRVAPVVRLIAVPASELAPHRGSDQASTVEVGGLLVGDQEQLHVPLVKNSNTTEPIGAIPGVQRRLSPCRRPPHRPARCSPRPSPSGLSIRTELDFGVAGPTLNGSQVPAAAP